MKKLKGQGTFEYILLLAGVLLVVVLAIVLLRGGIFGGSSSNINRDSCKAELAQSSYCYYSNATWNTFGSVTQAFSAIIPSCVRIATASGAVTCNSTYLAGTTNGTTAAGDFCCGAQP